jgi:imidazolonepropionase-like amidohydrolase
VIDFGDATLSPGFIDAHTHLSGMYNDDYLQGMVDSLRKTIPEQTLLATQNLRKTLMAGITTARDVGSSDFMDVGLPQRRRRRSHSRSANAGSVRRSAHRRSLR